MVTSALLFCFRQMPFDEMGMKSRFLHKFSCRSTLKMIEYVWI